MPLNPANTVRAGGDVDVVAVNAGIAPTAPIESTPEELWQRMLNVNLTGAFLTLQAAAVELPAEAIVMTPRHRLMIEMDAVYPGYGFAGHKGYHAPIHVAGLRRLGPSPIHRLGWAPVKAALAELAVNGELDL